MSDFNNLGAIDKGTVLKMTALMNNEKCLLYGFAQRYFVQKNAAPERLSSII
jgi:hypothetical protein